MTGIAEMIALAIDMLPQDEKYAIRDMIDELLHQHMHPDRVRIFEKRYDQLTQEAALTIVQAVKVKAMKHD